TAGAGTEREANGACVASHRVHRPREGGATSNEGERERGACEQRVAHVSEGPPVRRKKGLGGGRFHRSPRACDALLRGVSNFQAHGGHFGVVTRGWHDPAAAPRNDSKHCGSTISLRPLYRRI